MLCDPGEVRGVARDECDSSAGATRGEQQIVPERSALGSAWGHARPCTCRGLPVVRVWRERPGDVDL